MREILFRGKNENGVWVEGYYVGSKFGGTPYIVGDGYRDIIDESTVSQFTGRLDINGAKIWEWSIVQRSHIVFLDLDEYEEGELDYKITIQTSFVKCDNGDFWIDAEYFGWLGEGRWDWTNLKVIGNKFDNPELLDQNDKPN